MPTKKQLQQKVKDLEAQLSAGYEAPIETFYLPRSYLVAPLEGQIL